MRKYPKWIEEVEERIGINFRDKKILYQAFVHRSYRNENHSFPLGNNERLEFLGDKVLGLVIACYLFKKYQYNEGMMTVLHSVLVRGTACAKVAEDLGLSDFLLMSRGQRGRFKKRARETILSDTLEALIGAIYLDRGLGAAEIFISEYMFQDLDISINQELYIDYKSRLQELTQKEYQLAPRYESTKEDDNDHDHEEKWCGKAFLLDRQIGQGTGSSKKEAETEAAKAALEKEFLVLT